MPLITCPCLICPIHLDIDNKGDKNNYVCAECVDRMEYLALTGLDENALVDVVVKEDKS